MDPLLLATVLAVSGAIFAGSLALQTRLAETKAVVRQRTLGASAQSAATLTLPIIPRIEPMSERTRRMKLDLERAGLTLTLKEFLIIRVFSALACAGLGLVAVNALSFGVTVRTVVVVATALVGYQLPAGYVGRLVGKRTAAMEDQLLEVLVSMAKSLRAGLGLTQALDYAARETLPPLGPEIQRAVRELQLGADIEVIFQGMNDRMGSADWEIAATAMIIQRRVGGNLSEILHNVSETIRERRDIRSELHTLTARQRLMGNACAALPVFVAAIVYVLNPRLAELLVETPTGRIALAAGLTFEFIGLWLIRRFSVIEV